MFPGCSQLLYLNPVLDETPPVKAMTIKPMTRLRADASCSEIIDCDPEVMTHFLGAFVVTGFVPKSPYQTIWGDVIQAVP